MFSPARLLAALLLGTIVLGACGAGCSRAPQKSDNGKALKPKENELDAALDAFRRASTPAGYREALNLVGANTSAEDRARLAMAAQTRALLKERFALDDDELKEVESVTFQPLDAFHVEFCCQLRDAAKLLEQSGLTPLEQATRCFDWVVRQVILQERADDLLPPQAALRVGFGTAHERALVFLAVLQQFRMDGCVLALPGGTPAEPGPLLVGVVLEQNKKTEIYLFDPRLGRGLPGPGGQGIATLAQARAQPELLSPAGGPAPAKGELEVLLAPSLHALSPRMKFLEDLLVDRDRVRLAQEPDKLLARVEAAAGSKVQAWHGRLPAVTPVRALRAFLPVAEGGLDKSDRMELSKQLLAAGIVDAWLNLSKMRLIGPNELVPEARETLRRLTEKLFAKYVEASREFLLRGQTAQVHQRLGILLKPLNELELEALSAQRIREWRDRVNQAYAGRKPNPRALAGVWGEDQFFLGLLEARSDIGFGEVKDLTMIMLRALRKPIGQEAYYLQALTEHEEAEQGHARRQAGGKAGQAGFTAQWTEAENAWRRYLTGAARTPAELEARLSFLREQARNRDPRILQGLPFAVQHLVGDLHRGVTARAFLARAQDAAGKRADAVKTLHGLIGELAVLETHALVKDVAEFASQARGTPQARALASFPKDVGPDGGFAWLRRAAEFQLREWDTKK